MNFSYTRKTQRSVNEVLSAIRELAPQKGLTILGEIDISDGGRMIAISKGEWVEETVCREPGLLGFLPSALYVLPKDGKTLISSGNARIFGGVTPNAEIRVLAEGIDSDLRWLVNESSGAGDLKAKSVKLYSTATCPYCKMEKAYLDEHQVAYDVKMVDEDHVAGEEMVRKTGQMGVPVTEIDFEDGDAEYIIGFDKDRLNQLLNIK